MRGLIFCIGCGVILKDSERICCALHLKHIRCIGVLFCTDKSTNFRFLRTNPLSQAFLSQIVLDLLAENILNRFWTEFDLSWFLVQMIS